MTDILRAATADEVLEAIRGAAAEAIRLEVVAGGSKRAIGRPCDVQSTLDVSPLSGIVAYEPEELVLTARPGTPIAEIEAALAERGQHLAFEPADLRVLLGAKQATPTLGGVVAANLSGPRRIKAGAVRDHVLGMKIVTGRAEAVKTGGTVVKNVTGYELAKLLTGSWGTLAVTTEISVRTLPAPETVETVVVEGLSDPTAIDLLTAAMGGTFEASGAAHLPASLAGRGIAETCLRLEGIAPSVAARRQSLLELAGRHGPVRVLKSAESRLLWAGIRDATPFCASPVSAVWRISVAPTDGPDVVAAIARQRTCEAYYDWSGGLVWLATDAEGDAGTTTVRAAVGGRGHATLIRAPLQVRAAQPVFQPQPPALAALARRVKEAFDPLGLLNPGRMTADA
jgi:glycolate oxidase FAD binding subunit